MKITQEVRGFAAKQNAVADTFIAVEEAKEGMARMSHGFRMGRSQVYIVGSQPHSADQ